VLYGYLGFKVPKAEQPWHEDAVPATATATQQPAPGSIPTEKEAP
jgi:hypothetical protein